MQGSEKKRCDSQAGETFRNLNCGREIEPASQEVALEHLANTPLNESRSTSLLSLSEPRSPKPLFEREHPS